MSALAILSQPRKPICSAREKALALTQQEPERQFLQSRIGQLK
jgi:hypothetical protein